MKLYFAPFACSLSPHIALREAGIEFELSRVDLRSGNTLDGEDYRALNPKGYVPALQLDNGEVLTEGPAIVQYIADLRPESKLAPPNGSLERYRLQEMLNYITSELHKQFSPLFAPSLSEETRAAQSKKIKLRTALLEERLSKQPFLLGDHFSVADGYAFVVLSWARNVRVGLSEFPHVTAWMARIAERPAVKAALAAEQQAAPQKAV